MCYVADQITFNWATHWVGIRSYSCLFWCSFSDRGRGSSIHFVNESLKLYLLARLLWSVGHLVDVCNLIKEKHRLLLSKGRLWSCSANSSSLTSRIDWVTAWGHITWRCLWWHIFVCSVLRVAESLITKEGISSYFLVLKHLWAHGWESSRGWSMCLTYGRSVSLIQSCDHQWLLLWVHEVSFSMLSTFEDALSGPALSQRASCSWLRLGNNLVL